MDEASQIVFPEVLDACCGPRMMWFDKGDPRALFIDKRSEVWFDPGTNHGLPRQPVVISPDMIADFRAMPFPDDASGCSSQVGRWFSNGPNTRSSCVRCWR